MSALPLTETTSSYTQEQKVALCSRLSALDPNRAKEVMQLLVEYARKHKTYSARRLGDKERTVFGGKKIGSDYTFDLETFPDELLSQIELVLGD